MDVGDPWPISPLTPGLGKSVCYGGYRMMNFSAFYSHKVVACLTEGAFHGD